MQHHTSLPAARLSYEDIAEEARLAKETMKQAMELLKQSQEHLARATHSTPSYITLPELVRKSLSYKEINMTEVNKEIDTRIWKSLIARTPLWTILDSRAKDDFYQDIEKDTVELTVENIDATIIEHILRAKEYFYRGVVDNFKSLCKEYRTNDAFKIGKKIILENMFSPHTRHTQESRVMDMERAFYVLDNSEYGEKEQREGLSGYVNALPSYDYLFSKHTNFSHETTYFSVKFYKKGSLHITFKRPDLVTKFNHIIAQYYGETLAHA